MEVAEDPSQFILSLKNMEQTAQRMNIPLSFPNKTEEYCHSLLFHGLRSINAVKTAVANFLEGRAPAVDVSSLGLDLGREKGFWDWNLINPDQLLELVQRDQLCRAVDLYHRNVAHWVIGMSNNDYYNYGEKILNYITSNHADLLKEQDNNGMKPLLLAAKFNNERALEKL